MVDKGVSLQPMDALLLLRILNLLLWILKLLLRLMLLLKMVTLGLDLQLGAFHGAVVHLRGGYGGHRNRDGHLTRDQLVVWGRGGGGS